MYRHRFKIVCFCVLISTVFSYEPRRIASRRNQYNQETPDSSGANTNGGSFISYPKATSNYPYNPLRTGVYPYYGDVNRIRTTASHGQQAGHQQAQTQVDPSFPQQAINFPDGQQYSSAQGHTPLLGTYGGAAKSTIRFNYVCSIETWNYDCQFKDVILKLPQHSVTFGPVPNSKQKLAFQNSTLEYLPKSLIDAFPHMQVLNLEGLQIREIDSNTFQTAFELVELYMQNNQLEEIKPNTFKGARKLELLDLSYNAIESNRIAPNFLFAVPNLQELKINSNRISQLPLSQQNYYLQYITASENSISHIEADQFRNNHQLSELDFSYNSLEYFDFQQLDDKQSLSLINVNYNYLRTLHIPQYVKTLFARNNTIETLSSLEYCAAVEIDLQSNNLQNIDVLSNCNFLQKLDLSSNLLQNFRFSLVENMFELKVLNLSHNHLFQIDGKMQLNPYFNLQTLDLSHNHLSYGPPSVAFRTVIELYLQNNEFIEFGFGSSKNLQSVYLSSNEWSCNKLDSINKSTVIADQFHGECLSGFVKNKGICCRVYTKAYIQRLNEVFTEALLHNQTNQQRLATECRSKQSSSRPADELTRLRNEAAAGDDANKKLIDELWNITDLHKKFTKDIKTLEVERNKLNSQQTALKTAIEQQRQFYAIVKEGLISDQEKLTRILQYLKEREILNAELVTAREQDTLETDDDLKYIKQEKSDFEKSLADMKTIVEQLEKEETEKKKKKDDLERKANRHSVRIHGSSERVS